MKNNVIMRILELCEKRNVSIYRLAQLSDIPKNTLGNMISEDRIPTIPTIEKICDGLNITMSEFFTSDDLYPQFTDSQKKLLMAWESLDPSNQELAIKYLELLKDHQESLTK